MYLKLALSLFQAKQRVRPEWFPLSTREKVFTSSPSVTVVPNPTSCPSATVPPTHHCFLSPQPPPAPSALMCRIPLLYVNTSKVLSYCLHAAPLFLQGANCDKTSQYIMRLLPCPTVCFLSSMPWFCSAPTNPDNKGNMAAMANICQPGTVCPLLPVLLNVIKYKCCYHEI